MWNQLRRWFWNRSWSLFGNGGRLGEARSLRDYKLKWLEPGEGHPFPMRVLDVRPLTWTVVAMTEDVRIAEIFNKQRHSDGREYVDAVIENSTVQDCDLRLPHGGDHLEGVVFKAESMDVKWDLYVYNSVFLFVRSWNGQLVYRASAEISDNAIRVREIEAPQEQVQLAPQVVYFLLGSHAMGRQMPHAIPADFPNEPEQIAMYSFGMFGNRACFATYEDVTQIDLPGMPVSH